MVLFGATGDLCKRLVIPALYNLARTNRLPDPFVLIGVARAAGTSETWRRQLYDDLKGFVGDPAATFGADHIDEAAWARLSGSMSYVQGDATDAALHAELREVLDGARTDHSVLANVIFYLAVADRLFGPIVEQLGKAGLTDQPKFAVHGGGW